MSGVRMLHLFERLMEILSNPPILYYAWNGNDCNVSDLIFLNIRVAIWMMLFDIEGALAFFRQSKIQDRRTIIVRSLGDRPLITYSIFRIGAKHITLLVN